MLRHTLRTLRRRIVPGHAPRSEAAVPFALVALVVLSGCAGIAAGLPFAAPEPYTATGAALNGSDLRSAHTAGLDEAGSFESRSALVLEGDEHTFEVDRSAAVDRASNRSLSTSHYNSDAVEGDGLAVATYTTDNATYRRVVIDAGSNTVTRYDGAREPYDDGLLAVEPVATSDAAHADLVEAVADDVNWTQRGVERYDGGWVTRYEASGPGNVSAIGSTAVAEGDGAAADRTLLPETLDLDVRSINATLLVDPDGVVRRFSVHAVGNAAGQPVELTLTVTTDDLGATSVEPPAWFEEARTAASL